MSVKLEELQPCEALTQEHLFFVRPDGLSFLVCARAVVMNKEFLAEVDRLAGTNLQMRGTPIELAVDISTGRANAELETLLRAVWDLVFIRIPPIP